MAVNPKYYEKMSAVLDALIRQRKQQAIEYEAYLKKVIELAEKVRRGEGGGSYPTTIKTPALRAIYDNLPEVVPETEYSRPRTGLAKVADSSPAPEFDTRIDLRETVALNVDRAVRDARMAGWRGHPIKEKRIARAIRDALGPFRDRTHAIFDIVEAQNEY